MGTAALVTGAASGIGRATALRLAADGAPVACADVAAAGVEETAAAIRAAGGEALPLVADVTDEASVKDAVAATLAAFGGLRVVANVAGIGCFSHSTEVALADWQRILAVNLTGVFLVCREALPALLETADGRDAGAAIVNVASIAGLKGHAYAAAYSASKGGVVALTRTLAIEYSKRKVRVNAVCPGGVVTPLIAHFAGPTGADPVLFGRIIPPSEALAEPEEVAAAIGYLVSDDARHVTGTVLTLDDGVTA